MAYYYVRDNGTFVGSATGDGGRATSARTGAWDTTAANSYVSIEDACNNSTTKPAAGDYIIVANDHNHTYSGSVNCASGPAINEYSTAVIVISVDPSNQDQYLSGAAEDTGGSAGTRDYIFTENSGHFGMSYTASNDFNLAYRSSKFYDCTLTNNATGANRIIINTLGEFNNCTLNVENIPFEVQESGMLIMRGGSIVPSTNPNTNNILDPTSFATDGGTAEFIGVDLSAYNTALLDERNVDTTNTPERANVLFKNCKLHSSVAMFNTYPSEVQEGNIFVTRANCGSGAGAEYDYYFLNQRGDVEDSSTSYRDQSIAWPNTGSKTSLVVDTSTLANAGIGKPFFFDLPARWSALSSTATDLITVYLSGPSGLTDADIWVECIYPDGVNAHVPNRLTSRNTDFLNGTGLTADTGSSWTSGGTNNYRIEIDTSSDAGADCVPILRVYVATQATIYIDSQVDLS